jgi:protein SCO1/2
MTTTRRSWMLGAGAAALLAGCDKLGLSLPSGGVPFKGIDVTGANYSYSLPDLNGQLRTPADWKGKVAAVFFGYTQCPDFCPTSMAELVQVKKALGPDGERLQGVFITVDPERDTIEVLKAYVGHFDPSFVALRGTPEQAAATVKDFKGFFAKAPGKTPGSYTVDHTANLYLFDPQGRVRLVERYGSGVEALAADVKALLAQGSA